MVSWRRQNDNRIIQKNRYNIILKYEKGAKWSEISKNIQGRPENKVKNRFNSYIKKVYDIDNDFKLKPKFQYMNIDVKVEDNL